MAMAPNRRGGRDRHRRAANRGPAMSADLIQRMDFYAEMVKASRFTSSALAVAFSLLYRHLNAQTGRCDPSVPTLAEETGLSDRSVKSAIDELRNSGWWRIERGGGRGHTNSYLPRLETVNDASPFAAGKGEPTFTVSPPERVKHSVRKGEACFTRTSKNQNHTIDVRRSAARSARSRELEGAASCDFDIFWQIYPHRGGFSDPKKPARAKFETAVKRGVDPAAIIAGAERYRAHVEREGTAPRFVAQAQTWLNQERWAQLHEPEAPRLRVGMN
jgi:hypothetical protein